MAMRILLSKARGDFAATVNRVAYGQDRVILQRNGKDFVAVVPVEDLAFLEQLEDQADIAAARKARREPAIPWEKAKKMLGKRRERRRTRPLDGRHP